MLYAGSDTEPEQAKVKGNFTFSNPTAMTCCYFCSGNVEMKQNHVEECGGLVLKGRVWICLTGE